MVSTNDSLVTGNTPGSDDLDELLRRVVEDDGWPALEEMDEILRNAAKRSLTRDEMRAQKISFVMSMLPIGSTMTREQVAKLIDSRYG